MKIALLILRILCYAALAIVSIGAVSLFAPFLLDLCANQTGGTVKCAAPFYRSIFEFGFTVVMMSVFTDLPGILALGGAIFGVLDLISYFRGA